MAQGPAKISVACPHCNARQLESAYAKTTFCRKCGKHIDLRKINAAANGSGAEEDASEAGGVFDKFTRLFKRETTREIRCYHCNAPQTASSFAKSGSCTQCGGYIDLQDYKITGNYSRSIQTQGTITVGRGGDVTSTKVVCNNAIVHGKLHGNVLCTGMMHLKTRGRLIGAIEAKEVVVEKKSDIEFVRPLRVGTIEISGKVSARIYADAVAITKSGELDGSVNAKSISIEKGGIFHGDLFIGQPKIEQPELIPLHTPETPVQESETGSLDLGDSTVAFSPAT
jgi:cytoskeletal protein CcmA (bactofilin family)/endogenous inhibitor of DNA gyrase (YacG/DUF329 family)